MSHQIVITRDKTGSLWVKEMSATGVDRTTEFKENVSADMAMRWVRRAVDELTPPGGVA